MGGSPSFNEPLAIVGMACRLPGGDGLNEFWNLVKTGSTAWGPLPESRFNRELYFDAQKSKVGKSYSEMGAIVSDRPIDRDRCPMPDEWFEKYDIAHLIVCEVAADALRHAGYDPFALKERNVGVYVGHTGGSPRVADVVYSTCVPDLARQLRGLKSLAKVGESGEEMAQALIRRVRNRYPFPSTAVQPELSGLMASVLVSRLFGLSGPHLVVDAACASSFQALALAARSLRQGRIKMALVGGASYCKSDSLVLFSAAQSVSNSGSCPFSRNADGLVTAEGYVLFAIKTLSSAIADGDNIKAVIRGLGVSSDGKGKSLWAPRQEGQILAVHRAYEGGLDFRQLQYIEAHATSTQVGDATELGALSTALRGRLPENTRIPIGSIKGNVGHTLETAGVAGMVKTILAMQNNTIPPAVKNGELSDEIEWNECPFYVPFQCQDWPENKDGSARRAAVNAFGIGGLNVHVVLDEYRAESTKKNVSLTSPSTAKNLNGKQVTNAQGNSSAEQSADDQGAVAIVGAGCVLPGAFTLEAFWDLLSNGRDPKTAASSDRFDVDAWMKDEISGSASTETAKPSPPLGGFIRGYNYDWRRHKVPPKQVAQANPLQFMLLDAADQAFADGGFHDREFDRTRVGVVVGARFGGDFSNQLQLGIRIPEFSNDIDQFLSQKGIAPDVIEEVRQEFRKKVLEAMPSLIDETGSFTSSTLASRITKTFNLMGGALALDAGSCSAMAAIQAAVDILREKSCDMIVCAAGQRSMDAMTYTEMIRTGILCTSQANFPFDSLAQGMVPGEGCGVVILKRLADARRDGDKIRGVIRSIAAHHTQPNTLDGIAPAIRKALHDANISPSSVVALETDGYGVPDLDRQEISAVRSVYATGDRQTPLHLGTLRAHLGDIGAALGMAGLIKASLSLQQKKLTPNVHTSEPIAELKDASSQLTLNSNLQSLPNQPNGYAAIGINSSHEQLAYHLIIDNGQTPVPPTQRIELHDVRNNQKSVKTLQVLSEVISPRIIRLEATSLSDLSAQLKRLSTSSAEAWNNSPAKFSLDNPWRCAIVATDIASFTKKCALAQAAINSGMTFEGLQDQGVFISPRSSSKPLVAMLLPGQGSQYLGMFQDLCQINAIARKSIEEIDHELLASGFDTFASIAWQDGDKLGTDIWRTQASMLLANTLGYRVLRSIASVPDMIAAHSFGEFPALVAAGAWQLGDALNATRARCAAVDRCQQSRGAMLSVFENRARVESILQPRDQVWLCAENGPDQVVVGGLVNEIEQFGKRLSSHHIKSRYLAVPCPFHTPLLANACPIFARYLESIRIGVPQTPFVSGTLGRFVNDPDEIRDSLVAQLREPVQYKSVVEKLYQTGARVLVEVGPNNVLTQLARRTLSNQHDVTYLHIDHKGRSAIEQWTNLQAGLEIHGLLKESPASLTSQTQKAILEHKAPSSSDKAITQPGSIVRFDATARRRESMRAASSGAKPNASILGSSGNGSHRLPPNSPSKETPSLSPSPTAPPSSASSRSENRVANSLNHASNSHATTSNDATQSNHPALPAPSASTRPASSPEKSAANLAALASPKSASTIDSSESVRNTLVQFVVDQTGYPAEIVDFEADLESDLGIDSIKKAQLFGELGERYQLTVDPTLSLDDFTTLTSILAYLLKQPTVLDRSSPGTSNSDEVHVAAVERVPITADAPQSSGTNQTSIHQATRATSETEDSIRPVLVDFVVEQTGYPAEIVDMDADLESDLGIDSIKKAQLFGEIGERFGLQADPTLTLDDFTTLRHVHAYVSRIVGNDVSKTSSESSLYSASALPSKDNRVSEESNHEPTVATSVSTEDDWDIENILVNFVVEQTGYPAEIVDLDADLESDLGIDSIKKAQLFGEIGEQFRLEADPTLSLDDFTTLRHVKSYMQKTLGLAQPNSVGSSERFDEGFLHGQANESSIAHGLKWMASSALTTARTTSPLSTEENSLLEGIAAGSHSSIESILAWNLRAYELVPAKIGASIGSNRSQPTIAFIAATIGSVAPNWIDHQVAIGSGTKRLIRTLRLPGCLGALAGITSDGFWVAATSNDSHQPAEIPLLLRRMLESVHSSADTLQYLQRNGAALRGTIAFGRTGEETFDLLEGNGHSWSIQSVRIAANDSSHDQLLVDAANIREAHTGESSLENVFQQLWSNQIPTQTSWDSIQWTVGISKNNQWHTNASTTNPSLVKPNAHQIPEGGKPKASEAAQIDSSYEIHGVTNRFVARMDAVSSEAISFSPALQDSKLVLIRSGRENALAVEEKLLSSIAKSNRNAVGFSLENSLEASRTKWQTQLQTTQPKSVVWCATLVSGRDNNGDTNWQTDRQRYLSSAYWLLRDWIANPANAAKDGSGLSLTILTGMGGSFGLPSNSSASNTRSRLQDRFGLGIAGLAKAIRNEFPSLELKILDIDPTNFEPEKTANIVLSSSSDMELGLGSNTIRALKPALHKASELSHGKQPQKGDAWVVTGGARGVTATVARAIAQRYGVDLHLIGSTQPTKLDPSWSELDEAGLKALKSRIMIEARQQGKDPISTWKNIEKTIDLEKNLRQYSEVDVHPTYHCCDISDWKALDSVLRKIRSQSGPIRGILHGAGFEAAAKYEKKKEDLVEKTIAIKVDGAQGMIHFTQNDPVDFFIGFGSTSGWFGGLGQTDYSLANAMLAHQVTSLRHDRPNCQATIFHWHAWGEIGMAARPESKFALESFGLQFMPVKEGVAHVLAELDAGLPEEHVLITEAKFCTNALSIADNPQPAVVKSEPIDAQLEKTLHEFVINFVVEQTGYPAEIVDLKADLESDLGIDSIKKAQMFGEIGERFSLDADSTLTLDDFSTLSSIIDYCVQKLSGGHSSPVPDSISSTIDSPTSFTLLQSSENQQPSKPISTPLIEKLHSTGEGAWSGEVTLNAATDTFLKEHLLMGQPILPGVIGIEILLQAALATGTMSYPLQVENLEIHQGLKFQKDQVQQCSVKVVGRTEFKECELSLPLMDRQGNDTEQVRKLVSGKVSHLRSVDAPAYQAPAFPFYPFIYSDKAPVYHGPKFRQLDGLLLQHDGGFGSLKSPSLADLALPRTADGWLSPSALLDGCLVACAVFQFLMFEKRVEIPQGFERLVFIKPLQPGEKYSIRYQYLRRDARNSWYDFCVYNQAKEPVIRADAFRCVVVGGDGGRL